MKDASARTVVVATQSSHLLHEEEEGSGRLGATRCRPLQRHGRNARFAHRLVEVSGERGYALLIVLIALAIVGWLARDSIAQLFGSKTRGAGTAQSRVQLAPPVDAVQATPSAVAPIDRARSAEDILLERAGQTGKRIDAAQ